MQLDTVEAARKVCVSCAADFVPSGGRGRPRIRCMACSPLQLGLSAGRSIAKRVSATCINPACGRAFTSAGDYEQKFCSAACRVKISNLTKQQLRRDRSPRACKGCSATFQPGYADKRRDFCSRDCRLSATYRLKSGHTHERRARKFGCKWERVDKFAVFARDGWRCRICGIETPRNLSGKKHDQAPQLDHVMPLSKGGAHSYSNTQCACRLCNSRKGNKLPTEMRI